MKTPFARAAIVAAFAVLPLASHAWEPTKTVEFIVPAGVVLALLPAHARDPLANGEIFDCVG